MLSFLRKIESSPPIPNNTWKPDFSPVNASVSILLRLYIRDRSRIPVSLKPIEKQKMHGDPSFPLQLTIEELDMYFRQQIGFDPETVESQIFYMKRGDNEGDRFSGHVAFPGGKVENNESLLDGAIRETQEEVGLDLLDINNFALISQYPLTIPFMFMTGRRRMFVSSFIFVQLSFEDLQLTYDESEVQSSVWTSLEFLIEHDPRFYWFRPQK